jgi:PKD repeat protein
MHNKSLFRTHNSFGLVLKLALLLTILPAMWPINAHAGEVTFAWDYTASGAAGFVLYCGTSSGNYTIRSDAGNAVNYTQRGLTEGARYYCAVTAYDAGRAESGFSNEVSAVVPAAPPVVSFSASPTSGSPPLAVTFTNGTSGTVNSWLWNFGDGTSSTSKSPIKTYSSAGTYWVSLTATGPGGAVTKNASTPITVGSAQSVSGLVAAYGFDEGTGVSLRDSSGRGNIGTVASATWVTSGKYGRALSFNGTSIGASVPDSASLDLTSGMTVEGWVYPTVTMSGWRTILAKHQSGSLVYYLHANSGSNRPATGIYSGGERILTGTSVLPLNVWTHLAATYDGTNQRLYVNGVLVSTRAQTGLIATSTGAVTVGGNSVWGEYFKGLIDEVRIYNRALSASEIQRDMQSPVSGQ